MKDSVKASKLASTNILINDNTYMTGTIFSDEKQEWHVRQPYCDFDKMYDSSLRVFKKIEHNILEIGSSYIREFEGRKSKDVPIFKWLT